MNNTQIPEDVPEKLAAIAKRVERDRLHFATGNSYQLDDSKDRAFLLGLVQEQAARLAKFDALVARSPRLPSDVRNVVFEAVFDVVDKFNFPAQNCGTRPDVVEIGDVCGEVEKRIVALLRASATRG